MPQDPENWEQQENIKKTISSRKRPNVDATRAAGSPGKSAAMIQQASRNSAASTRNKETAKNQQAAEKAPVAGMAILNYRFSVILSHTNTYICFNIVVVKNAVTTTSPLSTWLAVTTALSSHN